MELHMERVRATDMPFVVEVYNSTIPGEATADTEPVTVEDWLPWLSDHQKDDRPAWILFENGRKCGWMSFSDYKKRAAYDGTAEVSIYLHEAFRGRGLAVRFLEMGLDHVRLAGLRKVLAVVFNRNRASVAVFRKLGFEEWGLLPGACLMNGTEWDVAILGLHLQ